MWCVLFFFVLTTGNGGWLVAWWSRETSVSPVTCEPQLAMHKCSSGDGRRVWICASFLRVGVFRVKKKALRAKCVQKNKSLKRSEVFICRPTFESCQIRRTYAFVVTVDRITGTVGTGTWRVGYGSDRCRLCLDKGVNKVYILLSYK